MRRAPASYRATSQSGLLRLLLACALVALATAACLPPTPPPTPAPAPPSPPPAPNGPTLTTTDWVTGRSKPWDLAFLPSGVAVYTENDQGTIYARMSDVETARPLGTVSALDVTATFDNTGEGGLMGIAVDPGYDGTADKRAYVCYSTTVDNRVARFDVDMNAAPGSRVTSWTPIVIGIPHNNFHDGCRVRFQPGTGALFVSTGDAGAAMPPQDDNSLGGKTLRITTDGAAWPGNASGKLWYTKGHRNPQGLAFRPGSNDPYSVEHGPDVNDEVNKLVNSANGGWNPNNGVGGYDQSKPMTDPTLGTVGSPIMNAVWSSGGVTVAPSGGTFLSGPQWKSWNGTLAVACLDGSPSVGQRLLIMELDASGTTLTEPAITALNRSIRLRSAVQGPDGNLYIVQDGSTIWKVVPS